MTMAILYGAGAGALHAVTGPDHVLSVGPAALRQPRGSWRIGLRWGVGHALGTLLLAIPALLLSELGTLPLLASWGERLAGLALSVMALVSLWSLRRTQSVQASQVELRGALWVGLVHGVTGAGSLLLVLPLLIAGSLPRTLLFLLAFALGSTLAMALLTWSMARLGGVLAARSIERSRLYLGLASLALGLYWLVG